MDEIDLRLLTLLEKNPFVSKSSLARELKISEGTVRNRVKKMLDGGKILLRVDYSSAQAFRAILLIKSEAKKPTSQLSQKLSKLPQIRIVYEVAGNYDLIARCNCFTAHEYNELVEKVRAIDGVVSTESLIVLDAV
ncbi:Lrp/AsnC family transcriptional regulator [Candidatus Micrarchaeota archaeon]|nr:Lrp/AsnC family transcriptional regulator [Candidatus Micrarchaeota archaeon]